MTDQIDITDTTPKTDSAWLPASRRAIRAIGANMHSEGATGTGPGSGSTEAPRPELRITPPPGGFLTSQDAEDHGLAAQLLANAQALGDDSMAGKLAAQGFDVRPAGDQPSPAEVMFAASDNPAHYDVGPALRALPFDVEPDERQAIGAGLQQIAALAGLPAKFAPSILKGAVETAERVSALSPEQAVAHAESVKRTVEAMGRDFEADRDAVNAFLADLRAKDASLYELLVETEAITDPLLFVEIAKAAGRRAKAKGAR